MQVTENCTEASHTNGEVPEVVVQPHGTIQRYSRPTTETRTILNEDQHVCLSVDVLAQCVVE